MFFLRLILAEVDLPLFQLYTESRFDPLVHDKDTEPTERANYIKSVSGYFKEHVLEEDESTIKKFGDISVITLNLYRNILSDQETIQSASNIKILLDEIHPTFLCLQGIDDTLLKRIAHKLKDSKHYALSVFDKFDIDMLNGQRNYFPIIYDQTIAMIKNSGYFEADPAKEAKYGSFIEVKDKRRDLYMDFTIINVDMYSSFNDVVSAEFSNIVSDINSFKEVEGKPVIIAGSFGTVPSNVKSMMQNMYKNTIAEDENNEGIPKTTLHAGGQEDDIQRDFILLRDPKGELKLNYARILREFLASDHYPVHSIFSYKTEDEKIKESIEKKPSETGRSTN